MQDYKDPLDLKDNELSRLKSKPGYITIQEVYYRTSLFDACGTGIKIRSYRYPIVRVWKSGKQMKEKLLGYAYSSGIANAVVSNLTREANKQFSK